VCVLPVCVFVVCMLSVCASYVVCACVCARVLFCCVCRPDICYGKPFPIHSEPVSIHRWAAGGEGFFVWSFVLLFSSCSVRWRSCVVLVVSCVVLFLLCVCVCGPFLFLQRGVPNSQVGYLALGGASLRESVVFFHLRPTGQAGLLSEKGYFQVRGLHSG